MKEPSYTGDKTPEESWESLSNNRESQLVDVRTSAEWAFVGVPDLSALGKEVILAAWQEFPDMTVNTSFVEQIQKSVPDPSTPLLFICRSGVRSKAAADTMISAGYRTCFNVLEGFEGDKDDDHHRGTTGGWKFHGLPWKQR